MKKANGNAGEKPEPMFSYKERLLMAFMSVFTFVFVILIFGCIDIYANNSAEMLFTLKDFIWWLLGISVALTAVLTLYFSAMRTRIFSIITAVTLILPVGGCLQQLVFGSLGELNNGSKADGDATTDAIIVAFWVLIAAAILLCAILGKKKWKGIMMFICVLMIGMNGASLVTDFVSRDIFSSKKSNYEYVLSKENIFSLSAEENIVVILVDSLDNEAVKKIRETDAPFYDKIESTFEGFTYFSDATSLYGRTCPSVPYMLTANKYYGEQPFEDYLGTTYRQSDFLSELKSSGFGINLYLKNYYTYTDASVFSGIADNISKSTSFEVPRFHITGYLMKYAFARNIPRNLMMLTYALTGNADATTSVKINCEGGEMYSANDAELYRELVENGISADASMGKNYTFLHLNGAHEPYVLNPDCSLSETETNGLAQSEGVLTLVLRYLDDMKKAGVYDNSTILVLADHGFATNIIEKEMIESQAIAMYVKPANAQRQPLQYSSAQVSHENLFETLAQASSLELTGDYAPSVFDVPEGEQVTREYHKLVFNDGSRGLALSDYEIVGDSADLNNWKYIKTTETQWEWY